MSDHGDRPEEDIVDVNDDPEDDEVRAGPSLRPSVTPLPIELRSRLLQAVTSPEPASDIIKSCRNED